MKKTISLLLACTLVINFAKAQDEKTSAPVYAHHIGGFAGASSGYGLSYRYFADKIGFQVTTTPIIGSDYTHLSLGFQLMYSINKGRITNLYGYVGNNYIYQYDKYENYYYYSGSGSIPYTETNRNITNISGVGIGFEICAGSRVGFNFQSGYGFYYRDTDDWNTGFDGGVGIFYKF